jgi:hypothetical protein
MKYIIPKHVTYIVNETDCYICTSITNKKHLARLKHKLFNLYRGTRTPGQWICHTCGNGKCINPDHLFSDTISATDYFVYPPKIIIKNPRGAVAREVTYTILENRCWECNSHLPNHDGYIPIKRDGKNRRLHVVMYEKYKSPVPPGMCVLHTCDNRKCINPDHLFLGTRSDNMRDMCLKGRHGKSIGILDESTVRKIIIAIGTYQEIADQFETTLSIVTRIRTGKTWKNISVNENDIPANIIDSILS